MDAPLHMFSKNGDTHSLYVQCNEHGAIVIEVLKGELSIGRFEIASGLCSNRTHVFNLEGFFAR